MGELFFDPARNQLLDPFGTLARPRRDDRNLPDRDVGIFAFRHRYVGPDSPCQNGDKKDPRDMPILDEETRHVMPRRLCVEIGRQVVVDDLRAPSLEFADWVAGPQKIRAGGDDALPWI